MKNRFTPGQAAKEELDRRNCRDHLEPFVRRVIATISPGSEYKYNWHIGLICSYLEACYRGEISRLNINLPPRHLKTLIVSIAFPTWVLGQDPSEQFLCASYSGRLSLKDSTDARLVVESQWYKRIFPEVELTGDFNTKGHWITTQRGHRIATSVGATSIGFGGNYLISDDSVNPTQALSDKDRKTANDWIDQGFLTRFNNENTGCHINVQQRLHVDDTTGHLLEKGGYEHLCLPLIAEEKTIIDFGNIQVTREKGDILHQERFGEKQVEQKKLDLGSYGFASQYQQRPAPIEGGMIKLNWFKRYDTRPAKFDKIVHSYDTASKTGILNDKTALTVWGVNNDGYYLLDVYTAKLRFSELKHKVINFAERDTPDAILIEDASSGIALIQDLKLETKLPVLAIIPHNSKVIRLDTVSPLIESGQVYLPSKAPWLVDFEGELINFPNIASKDTVDSFSQFLNWTKKPKINPRIELL